jgi:hypothetical protein
VSNGTKINNATVYAYLCDAAAHPDAVSAADFTNPGEVGIDIAGHGMAQGDYIIVYQTINYDFEYKVLSSNTDANTIFFAASQVAETFKGTEDVFKVVKGSSRLTLVHTGADGFYSASFDEEPVLRIGTQYYRIITVEVPSSLERRVFVDALEVKYG